MSSDQDDDDADEPAGEAEPRAGRKRKRRTQPRPKRIAVKKLTKSVIAAGWADLGGREARPPRPRTWAECGPFINACPFVGCRHHNFLDVNPVSGTITMNHPHREPLDLERPCSLAVAMGGPLTLDEVGEILNLTRERIRQIEIVAQIQLKRRVLRFGLEGKIG